MTAKPREPGSQPQTKETDMTNDGMKQEMPRATYIENELNSIRGRIKVIEKDCRDLKKLMEREYQGTEQAFLGQHGEVLAQLTLAFRHLEDARMRVGKVIQYRGDGVSVYDK